LDSVASKGRDTNWFRRRWLDFRYGHGIYLVFIMTFGNFITIQYSLLIDKVPELNLVFDNLWIFALVFLAAYVPLGMVIGYWHRKSQWKVEQEAMFRENVVGARIWLFTIKLIEGKATEEEKRNMSEYLSTIVSKKNLALNGKT
jgi:hypothetical protein